MNVCNRRMFFAGGDYSYHHFLVLSSNDINGDDACKTDGSDIEEENFKKSIEGGIGRMIMMAVREEEKEEESK